MIPSLSLRNSNRPLESDIVKMSSMLSLLLSYKTSIKPISTFSRIK